MWIWYVAVPLWSGGFICAGIWVFRSGLANMRHAQDTPTSKIRSAAQGYVELNGVLKQEEDQPLLQAALTGTDCLWWSYSIQQYEPKQNKNSRTSFGGGGEWRTIESDSSKNGLCFADDTGQCRINLKGAEISGAHETTSWEGRTPDPRTPDQRNALFKLFSKRYRYIESVLLPGRELYALGDFKTRDGQHLLEKPKDGRPFILSGNGEAKVIAAGRGDVIMGAVFIVIGALGAALGLWFLW